MGRALSTPLDVALACLLITASIGLLVSSPNAPTDPPSADRIGRAVLASTLTLNRSGHPVTTSVGDHLVTAATTNGLPDPTRQAIWDRINATDRRSMVHVTAPGTGRRIEVGSRPPAGASVDAASFAVTGGPTVTPQATVTITVRTWSR